MKVLERNKLFSLLGQRDFWYLLTSKENPETSHLSSTNNNNTLHQAKLPQIEFPKFSGDHTQWQSFCDKFTANLHISDLPPISKFTYLQSLLQGKALAARNSLPLTQANYEIVRDLLVLQQRFGCKERIVFAIYKNC